MRWKERLSQKIDLYLILDAQVCSHTRLLEILEQAVDNGIGIVQLRDKRGKREDILDFCDRALKITKDKVPFILNDSVELARVAGVDGVHLGQDDGEIGCARKILGEDAVIGRSCQTLRHAQDALVGGADYIGFGSVYQTLTKPERPSMDLTLLDRVINDISLPVFAIGGINLKRAQELIHRGVDRLALTRAICESFDAGKAVRMFRELLDQKLVRNAS